MGRAPSDYCVLPSTGVPVGLGCRFDNIFLFCLFTHKFHKDKRVNKKNSLNLRHSFCLICLATNMLEGWDIINLKGQSIAFLYDKREPRYKQIKMGYQI